MNDADLKVSLERAEETYEDLVWIRASLGTMLAEAIRRSEDLSKFRQRVKDLHLLIHSADARRTELKVELLAQQLKEAQEKYRRVTEDAKRASAALEEAKRVSARATEAERRLGLKARRLEELRREEIGHLERLRSEEVEKEEVVDVAAS
jgi:methylthioribose-1-phosphate isomerase